jgi:nifR3 family TIM-barrel protein
VKSVVKNKIKIGSVKLDNITVLAPLAGITNLPFRLLAKEAGCGLVCSEMVSANGLIHNSEKTRELLISRPEEKPLSVQIFGSEPAIMADAAAMVEASGADIIDINLGCPVRKVLKSGAGAALMKAPDKVALLIQAVRKAVSIPVTLKMRTGWEPSGSQALQIARIAQDKGVDAVALHPRTAGQGFSGRADWSLISAIKSQISIPVIGNGDIVNPQDAIKMKTETGCDAIMIGRAAIGQPWFFSQVRALLKGDDMFFPDLAQRFETMTRYLQASITHFGEERACRMMRSRLGWFVKGLRFSSRFRDAVKGITSREEALTLIDAYSETLLA